MHPDPLRESSDDRCPGALRLHQADDGHVARIRVPGGRLTSAQLVALCDLADAVGDGVLHLTSRGNVQVRGLSAASGEDVATRLSVAGLLPSLAHDRVRNIVASPYGGPVVEAALAALDAAVVADPVLARLSGRFLFGIDDGSGDVLARDPDLTILLTAEVAGFVARGGDLRRPRWQLVVGGRPTGRCGDPAALLVTAARAFLEIRDQHAPTAWRVRDLATDARELLSAATSLPQGRSLPPRATKAATSTEEVEAVEAVEAWVPLGSAPVDRWRVVATLADRVVLTPWRSVVLPSPHDPERARIALQDTGFALDPDDLATRTTACIGAPGCARSLSDVRRDAARLAAEHLTPEHPGRRLHVVGCERRCGHPSGTHLEAVATTAGYQIQER